MSCILYQCKDNWRNSLWATYQQQADAAADLAAATAHVSSSFYFFFAVVETTADAAVSGAETITADLAVATAHASSSFCFFFAAAAVTDHLAVAQDVAAAANSSFQMHRGAVKSPCFSVCLFHIT